MREVCRCPYCGGDHPHVSRVEGDVKLCWCQWCYHVHEEPLASGELAPHATPDMRPRQPALVPAG